MSFLVLPQHEQFYPEGLSYQVPKFKDFQGLELFISNFKDFQGLSRCVRTLKARRLRFVPVSTSEEQFFKSQLINLKQRGVGQGMTAKERKNQKHWHLVPSFLPLLLFSSFLFSRTLTSHRTQHAILTPGTGQLTH